MGAAAAQANTSCLPDIPYIYPGVTAGQVGDITNEFPISVPPVVKNPVPGVTLQVATATLPAQAVPYIVIAQGMYTLTTMINDIGLAAQGVQFAPGFTITPENTQMSITPPAEGAPAYADNLAEWAVKVPVIVTGTWREVYYDPVTQARTGDPSPPHVDLGLECQNLTVTAVGAPLLTKPVPATAPVTDTATFAGMTADLYQRWAAGQLVTMPAKDATYVHIPTCASVQGSQRPSADVDFVLPPVQVQGVGGHAEPVLITLNADVAVHPEPVQWDFGGRGGGPVNGRGAPAPTPTYDAVTQQWSTICPVYWKYSDVHSAVQISATQRFDFSIHGWFNNGVSETQLTETRFSRDATWGPVTMAVNQIQGVPYTP